jgi:hypothetical protein
MGGQTGICQRCGQTRTLVNSHIIPRSFFKIVKGTHDYAVSVDLSNDSKRIASYRQAGESDRNILCRPCEETFSDWDDYGFQILGSPSTAFPVLQPGESKVYGHRIDCDTDKIRRFALSVFWRASVSRISFYSNVRLGPYEIEIKNRLADSSPLSCDEFPVLIFQFEKDALGPYSGVLFCPHRTRLPGGCNMQNLYLPRLKVMMITDKRIPSESFRALMIQHPDSFNLWICPKSLMREYSFIPAIHERYRRLFDQRNC